ncbi:hypothetical protein ACJRO7_015187, partial [Eucalyptus globulus]
KAIVWVIKYQHQLPMERLLNFLVQFSLAKQKWSNRLPQFNLLRFCLKPDSRSLITKIVKCCCPEEESEKYRGEWALERHNGCKELEWSIRTEFGRSIATGICYQLDDADKSGEASLKEKSKWISEYMMHLLVNLPEMLSVPSGQVIYEHVRTVIKKLQDLKPEMKDKHSACQFLQTVKLPDHAAKKPEDPVIELG